MSDQRPPEEILWNLMRGGLTARALGVVADLRVADALVEGPRSVDDLSREVGADTNALHRLLRALASDGVFAAMAGGSSRFSGGENGTKRSGARSSTVGVSSPC